MPDSVCLACLMCKVLQDVCMQVCSMNDILHGCAWLHLLAKPWQWHGKATALAGRIATSRCSRRPGHSGACADTAASHVHAGVVSVQGHPAQQLTATIMPRLQPATALLSSMRGMQLGTITQRAAVLLTTCTL